MKIVTNYRSTSHSSESINIYKDHVLIGEILLKSGQQLWHFNVSSGELKIVDPMQKSIVLDQVSIYVPAINKKNAIRKILLQFGWKYDEKLKTGIPMFPVVEGEPQIIELGKHNDEG